MNFWSLKETWENSEGVWILMPPFGHMVATTCVYASCIVIGTGGHMSERKPLFLLGHYEIKRKMIENKSFKKNMFEKSKKFDWYD